MGLCVPVIRRASINGFVEVSRGCWRGCQFCDPTKRNFRCIPLDKIVEEAGVVAASKREGIVLQIEDLFSYGYTANPKHMPNRDAVIKLFMSIKSHPSLRKIYISHYSLPPAVLAPDLIDRINELVGVNEENIYGGILGIETGSTRLIKKYMRGKPLHGTCRNGTFLMG